MRYGDGKQKDNRYIPEIFPHIYFMDTQRDLKKFQDDLLLMQEDDLLKRMRSGCCMFDVAKECNHCFSVSADPQEDDGGIECIRGVEASGI